GLSDYANVHRFQAELAATPLGRWGKPNPPTKTPVNPAWDTRTPPVEQVAKLGTEAFFSLFADLTRLNPPHANDYPALHRMRRIGIHPGKPLSLAGASTDVRQAIENAGPAARGRLVAAAPRCGFPANGWQMAQPTGTYGADFLSRAAIAY